MSFLFSQPAPGILPANSVDFSEVETISANRILGNNLGVESTIQELQISDVATMLNLAQYAVGAASSTPTSIPVFADSNGKILSDSSGWRILGDVLMPFADGSGDIGGSAIARPGEVWVKTRINLNSLAASQILASDGSKNLVSLDTATYPSLTELSYVKGVTSALQSQLNAKVDSVSGSAPISSSGGTTPTISVSDFTQATSLLAGTRGTVPAPQAGDQVKFLRGDATWATAGVDTSGASDQQVLAYDSGTGLTTWQYAGLGDGNLGANNIILGQAKPVGLTGTDNIIVGTGITGITNNAANVFIGSTITVSNPFWAVGIGYNVVAGVASVAIGYSTTANSNGSVAIGQQCSSGDQSVSLGYASNTSNSAIAIGSNSKGTSRSVAVGHYAANSSGNNYYTSIGYNSRANGNECVSLGYEASVYSLKGIAIGANSIAGSGTNSIVIGADSRSCQAGAGGGTNNLVVGNNINALTTGSSNTLLGNNSGTLLSTGANNTIVGQGNGTALTTGSLNVVIGSQSFTSATTRSGVIAIGDQTAINPTGDDLIAMGQYSGSFGNGTASVAIGFRAAAGSSTWNNTVAIGESTGYQIGQFSSAVGAQAMAIGRSNYAVGIGAYALRNGESHYSTALGYYAGNSAASYRSVFLGAYAGQNSVVNDEFYLGTVNYANNATEKTNSLMYGVFNATPASQRLTINAATTSTYGLVANEIGGDFDTRIEGDTDQNLVFVDASTDRVGIGLNNPSVKFEVSGDSQLNGALVVNESGADKDMRVEGDTDTNLLFTDASTDKVGIGTATPAEKLEVNGNVKVSSGDLSIATAGKGFKIATGSNAKMGQASFVAVGTVTVNTTAVTANSYIFLTGVGGDAFYVNNIVAGTSFDIVHSSGNITASCNWLIIEPA